MLKRPGLLLLTLAFISAPAFADESVSSPTPTPGLHNVLVWAMGKAPADTADVELDVLVALAKHGVPGTRVSKLFPNGIPALATDVIAQMRAAGCDSLLVMRRRATVDLETPGKVHTYSSLQAFLNHRSQLNKPKNAVETDANVPIEVPNAYGNTMMEIVKGEVMVFDLATEKDLWHGDSQVKSAKDLPQSDYYKLVADTVASRLTDAGLIPPIKK